MLRRNFVFSVLFIYIFEQRPNINHYQDISLIKIIYIIVFFQASLAVRSRKDVYSDDEICQKIISSRRTFCKTVYLIKRNLQNSLKIQGKWNLIRN